MISRRAFLVNSTMAAGAVSLLRPLNGLAEIGLPKITHHLTILHTSNLYGQLTSLKHKRMYGLGGLNNIEKKIKEIRNEGVQILAVHTGNMIGVGKSNQQHVTFYKQMHAAGYDAVIPGKSDLVKGASHFEHLAIQSGLNVVAENKTPLNDLFPLHVIKKGISKVGIINLPAKYFDRIDATSFQHMAEVMNNTALQLRHDSNCSVVICMVQSNREYTVELAQLSLNIDLFVSGVHNKSIYNAHVIRNKYSQEVIVSTAGSKGTMMSRIDFTFNNNGHKIKMDTKAMYIGADEEEAVAMLKRFNYSVV